VRIRRIQEDRIGKRRIILLRKSQDLSIET